MKRLYKYTGTVSSFGCQRYAPGAPLHMDLILSDLNDDEKAPVRIEAIGGMAEYINKIEMTDAEERYISATWYYDSLLMLHAIEIPSTEPGQPAKIIAVLDPLAPEASIFGPAEYIETSKPEPMDRDQRYAWYSFRCSGEYSFH